MKDIIEFRDARLCVRYDREGEAQLSHRLLHGGHIIHAHGHDLGLKALELVEVLLQLHELPLTHRSEIAPVEDEDNVGFPHVGAEMDTLEVEIGRLLPQGGRPRKGGPSAHKGKK